MNKKTLAGIVCATIVGLVAVTKAYDWAVTPKNIQPDVLIINENTIRRYSYIPHGSLFRSARSWHDRVIEEYHRTEDDQFELVKRTKVIYHYPILGERSYTTTEIEEVKNE
jgi:hypothetical protein